MTVRVTEQLSDHAVGLDQRPAAEIAMLLLYGQIAAAEAVRGAVDAIALAAGTMADTISRGGRLHYVAAGSSGLMAAADAQELGGTFSIPADQLRIHMAGGLPQGVEMPGDTEDQTDGLEDALQDLSGRDCVIAVSASGSTPYTLAAADIALGKGARLVAIANNSGAALLRMADHPVLLETPPEVLSGSTRMGAGSAQKIALNMLSTLMAVKLGHVHDGMMVNLRADNAKLLERATGMVGQIADVPPDQAKNALRQAKGQVKPAVLIAARGVTLEYAERVLKETGGHLRAALTRLSL